MVLLLAAWMWVGSPAAVPVATAAPASMEQRWATRVERWALGQAARARQRAVVGVQALGQAWLRRAAPNSAQNLSRAAARSTGSPRVRAVVLPLAPVVAAGSLLAVTAGQRGMLDGPAADSSDRMRGWLAVASGGGEE